MSFAEMTRAEVATQLFVHGRHIAAARAKFIAACSEYGQALGDAGNCTIPSFRRDRFVDQVMDTADAFLEDETQRDLGI